MSVALLIMHAKLMRRIIMWPVRVYHMFPHYLINCTILFFGKELLDTKCVFWVSLQLLCEKFLILRRIQRHTVVNERRSSCEVPVIHGRY